MLCLVCNNRVNIAKSYTLYGKKGHICQNCRAIREDPNPITCVECGNYDSGTFWRSAISTKLRTRSLCFNCNHYYELMVAIFSVSNTKITNPSKNQATWDIGSPVRTNTQENVSSYVIINNNIYTIGPKTNFPKSSKGFGGMFHTIKKNDGTIIQTDNLWHCGQIPAHFRARMPDTAVFVSE